jgi:ketosteroid isomerase-like protein
MEKVTQDYDSSHTLGTVWSTCLFCKNGRCNVKIVGLLMVFVCSASLILSAENDSDGAVQSKIIALEKAWNQAYKLGDKRALDRILDDQIVLINDDGSLQTKAAFLASVQKSNSQEQQVAPESMTVHVFGNTAISTGVFRAKGVESGKPYMRRERFVDTWIYKGGNWVCVATNATPVLH